MPPKFLKYYTCVLCKKRTEPSDRAKVNLRQRKVLKKIPINVSEDDVIRSNCRTKCYRMEKQKMTVTVEDNEENEETKTIKTTNTPLSPPSTRLPFSSASNSHAYCFVCKRPGPKLVEVPTGERYNIFLQTEIIVPAGARCCPNHLMDGKLSQEAMHSVRRDKMPSLTDQR
ncbi:hypothetical protein FSP39_003948 [Pinctada imbricata]|uniref:Uncharacterized protein n=1 Tax=Pinctada imbricata TaxID=66713 RepID=A0AA89BLH6_PINIB|nr:hypothetical protein FSP39_003948 [Pinctada imbricata]